ncbi:intermembrane transport protein PqiB [Halochromatium glycolicum]|uniref:Mammalian cell entry protein n=1 Tax=Halochromatium glycolicum TaxID=85075 RepID=A0AAJ0U2A9_9GAMM|nr:MlaD family protein [Halochromatium glycolicum]MBK1703976.1 mammalian cell entry protein [Halochromatium glycolicum]
MPSEGQAQRPAGSAEPALPEAEVIQRDRFSLVWLLPLIALIVGGWLAYKTWSEQGPTITISFKTASGLQAGKTKVKFKDVEIGQVTRIDVTDDLEGVKVTAQLTSGSERYLTEETRFWVARPRVTASRVSGLETLLSGAYIAIDPVMDGRSTRHFKGLAEPPVITTDEPGTRFRLRSPTLGSLNLGSPVYYRHIQVGQVINYQLDDDGAAVTIDVFVTKPHDRLVYTNTRFWNASGIDLDLSADGVALNTESLVSILLGGVAFDTPDTLETKGAQASANQFFPLYASRAAAHERTYLNKERYLMLFSGSVRGLSIGAPVMLHGIQVGEVLDIQLRFDPDRLAFSIPVLIEIEPERISVDQGVDQVLAGDSDVLKKLIAAGMRGQLKTGSLLTGQLYVDLDFHPDAPPAELSERNGYRVLPTVPAPIEAITTKLRDVLAKVDAFPLEQIGSELTVILGSIREIATGPELKRAIADLEQTLTDLSALAEQLDTRIAPEMTATLTEARRAVENINGLVGPDAPLNNEMVRTLRDLSSAARSIRTFADYLDRHPEALIRGKGGMRQ